jgi:acetolactate synthase-1/2/3 large subunit
MTKMRGADAILDTLSELGTSLAIGYIGHTTQELADALRRHSTIRSIHPATELGGAHVINGYNLVKGAPAAVGIWHTCGTMMIPPALYEGMTTRIPSVHLGLNVDGSFKDREAMQEMEHLDLMRPVTRYATRVERPDKLPESIERAFQRAQGVPMGPTFIDVPFDLTIDVADMTIPRGWVPPTYGGAAQKVVDAISEMLVGARRPVLIIGGGAVRSGAADEVRELAELLGIPVTTTHTSQGILPESHPLALGTSGPIGWPCANQVVAAADVVLAVGTRMSDWGWAQSYAADLPARLVHIDADPAQIGNFYIPDIGVVGDAKTVLAQLLHAIPHTPGFEPEPFESREAFGPATEAKTRWVQEQQARAGVAESPMSPWWVIRELEKQLNPEDILVSDAGNNTGWVFQGTTSERPGRLLTSFGAGMLGAGLPMALGAKLAAPTANVVAAVGDGGFGYSTNEIAMALQEGIAVTVVVFNDGVLGANNGFMNYLYGKPYWTQLNNPDFAALSRAYGGEGERVEDPQDIGDAVKRGLASGTVYVIDVPISQEYGYPSTGVGGKVRWEPRDWPADSIGTRSPDRFSAHSAANAQS